MMQLLDAAHFKRDRPAKVIDFMNFQERVPVNEDEDFDRIDRECFGL